MLVTYSSMDSGSSFAKYTVPMPSNGDYFDVTIPFDSDMALCQVETDGVSMDEIKVMITNASSVITYKEQTNFDGANILNGVCTIVFMRMWRGQKLRVYRNGSADGTITCQINLTRLDPTI